MEQRLCDYGCGDVGRYKFKNGKWCCSELNQLCPERKREQSKLRKSQDISSKGCNKRPYKEIQVPIDKLKEWINILIEKKEKKPRYWSKKYIDSIHEDFYDAVMTITKDIVIPRITLTKRIWLIKNDFINGVPCKNCNKLFHPKIDSFSQDPEEYKDAACGQKCGLGFFNEKSSEVAYRRLLNFALENNLKPLFDFNEYKEIERIYDWECYNCGYNFPATYGRTEDSFPKCKKCAPRIGSRPERLVKKILDENGQDYVFRDTSIIFRKELDFLIEKFKLGIEVDGLYWHSDVFRPDINYHINKTESFNELGYSVIHIFEDEIIRKKEIVKSRIESLIGKSERIYARKCELVELTKEEKSKFLKKNHLQGNDQSIVRVGLKYDNEIISIMTFGVNRNIMGKKNKSGEYELYRFCHKLGITVVGGFSKMLKYFEKNYKPKKITTYADRRWSEGNVYKKNGMKFSHNSKPNYWYCKGKRRLHRAQFQKHKLKDKLENFDPNLTEKENMRNNNWTIVYDCGSACFEKIY